MKRILCGVAFSALATSSAFAADIGATIAQTNTFLTVMIDGIKKAATDAKQPLQVEIADEDVNKQLSQVQNFIAAKADAIIVNAVDTSATASMTKLANEAGIPIVYVNRQPIDLDSLGDKGAFVGSSEKDSGTLQAKEVCRLLKEAGKSEASILVMQGILANEAAVQRTQDVHDVIATPECNFIKIIDQQPANWDPVKAQDLMTNWIAAGHKPDAVVSNNDDMAIGAINAMKAAGWDMKDVIVAGIDATQEALSYMKSGDLDVTVFQDATGQGAAALQTAMKLAKGEKVVSPVWIPFELVTPANVEHYANKN